MYRTFKRSVACYYSVAMQHMQARSQKLNKEEAVPSPYPHFPVPFPLPFASLSLSFLFPFPPFPLEVGPLFN